MIGASLARSTPSCEIPATEVGEKKELSELTMTFRASPVNACATDEDIMYDGKHTLAPHPSTILILDLAIVEDGGFIKLHAPAVYSSCKGYLIWMEVFPA